MGFELESPWFLLLLLAVPAVLLVLRHTLMDSPRAQLALSAAVRVFVILLLVLAAANLLWVSQGKNVAVMVLADLSDSVPRDATEQVRAFLANLEQRVSNPSKAGFATFAAAAQIYQPVENRPRFEEEFDRPANGADTSIEKALLLAREAMPADSVNRVVLFTDGNETEGNALATAKRLAEHGLRIYPIPYKAEKNDEILLEDLVVPSEVKKGQSFAISAVADSTLATQAVFTLYRDGFKVQEKEVELKPGANPLTFQESNPADGLIKYELRVRAEKDFYADNNVSSGVVFVAGEPRVLLLEGEEREARHLTRALEAENIRVDAREAKGMPGTLEELAAFDAVMFSDLAATDVSVRQMELLRTYVEDLGGGFVMLGGEDSFGLGGYYRTSIEDALPVRMKSEKKKDTPSLAMVLIIDRSGSMSGEKVELAKEAAIAAVELLNDRDYVGVVAFDTEYYWIVDMQSASNRSGIVQSIETIEAGGGTNLYPAMEAGYEALASVPAAYKHAIALTDGQSAPGDFPGIVGRMVSEQITVSTVAVGEGADVNLLEEMAQQGRGRYYFTADPQDVPQIFTKETMAASKSSLVEEPFLPQVFRRDQVVEGIDWETAPFLFGYVVTTPKATADVTLVSERGDPLLASWRFGLGKSAAFASDAKSRWAADWLNWPGYGKFWSQVIRDVMRTSSSQGTETRIEFAGNRGRIVVDSVDENGNFVNGLTTTAQLIRPDLSMNPVSLPQTAPGRYEASFPMDDTGSYLLRVRQTVPPADGSGEGTAVSDFTRGITLSYKPEYRHLSTNEDFLRQVAEVSGGKFSPTLDEIMSVSDEEAVPVRHRLWPYLLIAALLLFVAGVALRRMDLAGWRVFGTAQRYG